MTKLENSFTEFIPEDLVDGTLYISMDYATAVHLCACGCGSKVVTPFSPKDWKLSFDGRGVSLHPSIGNWSFDCKSHYWIKNNQVIWAPPYSKDVERQITYKNALVNILSRIKRRLFD